MALKKTALTAAIAAAALGLSACGSDSDTDTATTTSTSTSTTSTTSGTGTASDTGTTSSSDTTTSSSSTSQDDSGSDADFGDAQVGDQVPAADLAAAMSAALADAKSGHMKMDMGGIKAEGDFEIDGATQNSKMTMEMGGQKMDLISVDGVNYMKGLTGGTKWVKMDADAAGTTPNLNQFDPSVMAKAFGDTKAKVSAKDGDTTTYDIEMDLKEMLKATDTELPTGTSIPDSIPVTYVLDDENRPVKSTIDMGMKIVIDYSDFGKSVSIEAPPASEVTTM